MCWRGLVTKKADRVIVPSRYLWEEALRNGFPAEKVQVVPLFTGKNPAKEYFEPENNVILFVGRTDPSKGIAKLLAALSIIREKNWKAYIIGGKGEGLSGYEKTAENLKIKENTIFLNNLHYADLDEYYKKASIVVLPSMCPESFGLVGIEAMSFGKPVIAFDVGGPREWLVDGETGFLVTRGNVRDLAEKISWLLDNKSLAREMGEKGKERVENHYRKEAHLKRLIAVYKEAINSWEKVNK